MDRHVSKPAFFSLVILELTEAIWYLVQVCGLEWNRHHKELLSGHGFSTGTHQNHLCLWRYPSMTKIGNLNSHASRVLHLSQVWLILILTQS